MKFYSDIRAVERSQPWLGTLVSIRVEGLPVTRAHEAIDAAFDEIALVHRKMSFHEPESDVGRLNRFGHTRPLEVHQCTWEVLQWALRVAERSEGCFDIAVGRELVEWEFLPRPAEAFEVPAGSWQDIELHGDGRVEFHRPLWIDLGGIAKGYAVDRAARCLQAWDVQSGVVNAGGDVRVLGEQVERIGLELAYAVNPAPVIELTNGSIASSSGHRQRRWVGDRFRGPHVHGATRSSVPTDRFVCVLAESCVVADALTKVVMAEGSGARELLRSFGAFAHRFDPLTGWEHFEGGKRLV